MRPVVTSWFQQTTTSQINININICGCDTEVFGQTEPLYLSVSSSSDRVKPDGSNHLVVLHLLKITTVTFCGDTSGFVGTKNIDLYRLCDARSHGAVDWFSSSFPQVTTQDSQPPGQKLWHESGHFASTPKTHTCMHKRAHTCMLTHVLRRRDVHAANTSPGQQIPDQVGLLETVSKLWP